MSKHADFWDELTKTAYAGDESLDFAGSYLTATEREEEAESQRVDAAVERRISGRDLNEGAFNSVRELTDSARAKAALTLPVEAGTRVQFIANAGSVLAYDDPPAPNESGVVVAVKSASGQITSHNGVVFAKWSDGKTRAIHAEHLRLAAGRVRTTTAAMADKIRVASLGDLSEFLRFGSDTLVHKATKDLWKVRKDGGDFVIERLFAENGSPLKV